MKVIQKNIIYSSLILILILFCQISLSQTILLERSTEEDTIESKFGQNNKHFIHTLLGVNFTVGSSENGFPISYFSTNSYQFGILYKYKLTNHFSIGSELCYNYRTIQIRQNDEKYLPSLIKHDNEFYQSSNLSFNGFVRINIEKRRGNKIGKFIDLGAGVGPNFLTSYHVIDIDDITNNEVEVIRRKLDYINSIRSFLFIRAGIQWFYVYGHVELSPFFDDEKTSLYFGENFQPPKMALGLQFKLF